MRDLTGQVFGRLTVVQRMPAKKCGGKVSYWHCLCECGNHMQATVAQLTRGNTKSCGCLRRESTGARSTVHGATRHHRRTGAFKSYMHAQMRCTNPRTKGYHNYGGRGIEFRFTSFDQFFAELGHRPMGETLDRINVNGHYEPGNVKWSTPSEQAQNKRRARVKPHGMKGTGGGLRS